MTRILYLHGFASSPASKKARFFAERLRKRGETLEIPALDGGHFESMTITSQLEIIEHTARGEPVALLGSSLGGYLAALYAARHAEVTRLVLLAPAFRFAQRWIEEMPPDLLESWRRTGELPVHHHGELRSRCIGYQLIQDGLRYEEYADFRQPALIFHGVHDRSVTPALSENFVCTHPNATLRLLESDHELLNVLDSIWSEAEPFLFAP